MGNEYQNNKLSIVTKPVRIGDATFKVRIPTVGEQEQINKRIIEIDEEKVEQFYHEATKDLWAFKDEPIPENSEIKVEYLENDILVNGKSMREAARTRAAVEARVMETFKLIVPQEGADWSQVSYQDIQEELPWEIQLEVVNKILEAINPSYKDIKEK